MIWVDPTMHHIWNHVLKGFYANKWHKTMDNYVRSHKITKTERLWVETSAFFGIYVLTKNKWGSMISLDLKQKMRLGSVIPTDLLINYRAGSMIPSDPRSGSVGSDPRSIFSDPCTCLGYTVFLYLETKGACSPVWWILQALAKFCTYI